eukprot:926477-Alexandrium_andersonii.AAC.1
MLNGWITTKRLGGNPVACRFCGEEGGGDSLAHYANCVALGQFFHAVARGIAPPSECIWPMA